MFYLISQQTITRFCILTTLLLTMLFVWGCDSSIDTPTSGTTEMESDESFAAAPAVQPAQVAQIVPIPLKKYFNAAITDSLTIAQPIAPLAAVAGAAVVVGYGRPVILGYIFPVSLSGTVPLNLYWSGIRKDFLTTTGLAPVDYEFVRVEGYIYPIPPQAGVVHQLVRYWIINEWQDYLTTTGSLGAVPCVVSRMEGYILP